MKQREDINLSKDVQYDANIVQDLQVQEEVDTSQAGTYDTGYLITINIPALQEKLQEQKVSFDLSGTTCKVQADIKVNVTQEEKKNTSAVKKDKETTNTQSRLQLLPPIIRPARKARRLPHRQRNQFFFPRP